MLYSTFIMMRNFDTDVDRLQIQDYTIHRVTSRNRERLLEIFREVWFGDYYLQRDYQTLPSSPTGEDPSGLGAIPYHSDNFMLLLRLFKPGDLVFVAQAFRQPDGKPWSQYRYPQAFSSYHSPKHYSLNSSEVSELEAFYREAPTWPGWDRQWFKVARRYFMWGGSKEFSIQRPSVEDWEVERVLDYFIALEAAVVPESDFVSRRLRERAAALIAADAVDADSVKKRLTRLYDVRSTIAHGGTISRNIADVLRTDMSAFESDVRKTLKAVLKHGSPNEQEAQRKHRLASLFDVSDQDRAEKLMEDFKKISSGTVRAKLAGDFSRHGSD